MPRPGSIPITGRRSTSVYRGVTRKGIRLSKWLITAGREAEDSAFVSVRRALIAVLAGLAAMPAVASAGAGGEE